MLKQGEDCPITPGSQANTPPVFSESRRRWVWLVSNAQLAVLITYALSLKSNQENLRMLTRKQGSSWPENRVRKASVDCAHGKREEPAHAQACFTMVRFSLPLKRKAVVSACLQTVHFSLETLATCCHSYVLKGLAVICSLHFLGASGCLVRL